MENLKVALVLTNNGDYYISPEIHETTDGSAILTDYYHNAFHVERMDIVDACKKAGKNYKWELIKLKTHIQEKAEFYEDSTESIEPRIKLINNLIETL